jgi:hypothetical protein
MNPSPQTELVPAEGQVAVRQTTNRNWRRTQIASLSAEDIADLAYFYSSVQQGDSFEELPVYCEVSCGRPTLPIGQRSFELNTWRIILRIHLKNAQIKENSMYVSQPLQRGEVRMSEESITQFREVRDYGRGINLKADITPQVVSIALGALFRFGATRRAATTRSRLASTQIDITLMDTAGENALGIGHPDFGDPRHPMSLLKGSYRCESRDSAKRHLEVDPMFILEPIDPTQPMEMTIFSTVPLSRLCVLGQDRNTIAQDLEAIDEHVVKLSAKVEEDYIEALRQQMLQREIGIRLAENQQRAGLPVRNGEFIVHLQTTQIDPRSETL